MLANFLIGLREGLEAALVVSILLAYLKRSGRADQMRFVWLGVAIAIAVSLAFGAILTFGPQGLTFEAQEIIGASLSLLAVGLITWMIFWMGRNARSMKRDLEGRMELAVTTGGTAVMLLALMAVGREGLETALFLWAGAQASATTTAPLLGALVGLLVAAGIGYLMYTGAVRLNLRVFFQWTGLFLVVVAAGIVSYAIYDFQEAGVLPGLNSYLFDVSEQIPPSSWYAAVAKGIVNFQPATTYLQAVGWLLYIVPVAFLYIRMAFGSPAPAKEPGRDTSPSTTAPVAA